MIENLKVGDKIDGYNSDFPIYTFNGVVDEIGTLYRFLFEKQISVQEVPYIRIPCDDFAKKVITDCNDKDYPYSDYQYLVEDNVKKSIIRQKFATSAPKMIYIGKVETVMYNAYPYCYLLENDIEQAKKRFIEFYDNYIDFLQETIQGCNDDKKVISDTKEAQPFC